MLPGTLRLPTNSFLLQPGGGAPGLWVGWVGGGRVGEGGRVVLCSSPLQRFHCREESVPGGAAVSRQLRVLRRTAVFGGHREAFFSSPLHVILVPFLQRHNLSESTTSFTWNKLQINPTLSLSLSVRLPQRWTRPQHRSGCSVRSRRWKARKCSSPRSHLSSGRTVTHTHPKFYSVTSFEHNFYKHLQISVKHFTSSHWEINVGNNMTSFMAVYFLTFSG